MEEDRMLKEALSVAKIHPALDDAVFHDMPDFSKTGDKKFADMLYVYFKLCSILDYDSRFWVSGESSGPFAKEHNKISKLSKITPENNLIVCYEFNVIFHKMLEKIGIKSEIDNQTNKNILLTNYGEKHIDIKIPTEQFEGEFSKGFIPLYGYVDVNSIKISDEKILDNLGLKEEHKKFANKILQIVKEQARIEEKKQKKNQETEQKIEQLEKLYKQLGENKDIALTDQEKLKILFEQVSRVDLNTFASVEYMRKLYKAIDSTLTETKTKYVSLRERIGNEEDCYDMIGMFFLETEKGTSYIKLTPPNKLESISHDDLEKDFMSGKIDYIHLKHVFRPEFIIPKIESPFLDEKYKKDYVEYQNFVKKASLYENEDKKELLEGIKETYFPNKDFNDYFDYLIEKGVTFNKSEDAQKEENTTSKTKPQSL